MPKIQSPRPFATPNNKIFDPALLLLTNKLRGEGNKSTKERQDIDDNVIVQGEMRELHAESLLHDSELDGGGPVFRRMNKNKGFTLVELMIVVAIIGILAAVAVPYYQRYISKSRLTSMIFPGVHVIETNMAAYFAFQPSLPFPTGTTFAALVSDANTAYFTPSPAGSTLNFTIKASGNTSPLHSLDSQVLCAHPLTAGGKITGWALSGSLAESLGLANEK